MDNFKANRESLVRQNQQMTLKPVSTWSIQGDFIYRHHNELRVQLYVPKEETFIIPLKYIDVTRSTHTDLDVMQETLECRFEQTLGEICPQKEKPPMVYMWSGRRLTKTQTTTRPDKFSSEVWTKIGKAVQNREKQEWAMEKPEFHNARRLSGIYFIDPDDKEHSETLKNERRELERPMAPATPCKRIQSSTTKVVAKPKIGDEKRSKTMYSRKVESHESTRQRAES